jgi:hypothetical protein
MKVLITGDRNWQDRKTIHRTLRFIQMTNVGTDCAHRSLVVIQGEASGADSTARDCARDLGIEVWSFPANWKKYGRAAGPLRNKEMLDREPDLVVAFHNDLSKSKGTKNCVGEAKKRGIPVVVVRSQASLHLAPKWRRILEVTAEREGIVRELAPEANLSEDEFLYNAERLVNNGYLSQDGDTFRGNEVGRSLLRHDDSTSS